jgi:suppressor for copper-sensitivity B
VRAGFLASSAGIVASFLALAGALITMKGAGIAVGWGIQFQQPVFLVAMTALVALFAANLWGLFEVPMPAAFGQGALAMANTRGLAGHFLTGAFATLLATPCSAPFLGTAVGFALAAGPVEILAIFAALGVGLALPYLAVAAWPALALALPRPGPWMVWLRRALGLALAATAIWLITVLAAQQDVLTVHLVAGLIVVALAALGLRRAVGIQGGALIATAAILAALAVPLWLDRPAPATLRPAPAKGAIAWIDFDRAAIAGHVAAGRTVLVDVTADWCLTCQVNKQLVLERGEIARRIGGAGIVAMRADWTRPSLLIADYLVSFGRYGIPFNAVYGPGAPDGAALPELLTADAVLAAFDRASKPLQSVAK